MEFQHYSNPDPKFFHHPPLLGGGKVEVWNLEETLGRNMTGVGPVCKDCIDEGITTYRKPVEGAARNRCTTHQRNRRATTRVSAHARLCAKYGITEEEYQAIKASQGGKCFICQKATGARKALAIDHDHALGYTREAVRAVLCGPCNKLIGYLDVMALARAIVVLQEHPAQKVLNSNGSAL